MRSDRQPALPMPDEAMAQHYLTAAEAARHNPYFTPDQQRERAAYYEAQARALSHPERNAK